MQFGCSRFFAKARFHGIRLHILSSATSSRRLERRLQLFVQMTVWDFITIYIACGSPFAVHRLVTRSGRLPSSLWSASLRLIAWPAFAVGRLSHLVKELKIRRRDPDVHAADPILAIRAEMERAVATLDTGASIFEFREVFDRYAGLSLAKSSESLGPASSELFDVSNHSDPWVANACLARKNRVRVEAHLERARADLLEIISPADRSAELLDLVIRMSKAVGDAAIAMELATSLEPTGVAEIPANEPGGLDLWTAESYKSQPVA